MARRSTNDAAAHSLPLPASTRGGDACAPPRGRHRYAASREMTDTKEEETPTPVGT